MTPDRGTRPRGRSAWGLALGAGSELVVSVLAGVFVGRWLDGRLGTQPWLALLGTVAGISLGLYRLIRETAPSKDAP